MPSSRASLNDISSIDEDTIERVPLMPASVPAAPKPIDQGSPKPERVRQVREQFATSAPTDPLVEMAARYQAKEIRRQTSFRIYPSLDEELQARVHEYNRKRIPITREDIINEALAKFLGVALPR